MFAKLTICSVLAVVPFIAQVDGPTGPIPGWVAPITNLGLSGVLAYFIWVDKNRRDRDEKIRDQERLDRIAEHQEFSARERKMLSRVDLLIQGQMVLAMGIQTLPGAARELAKDVVRQVENLSKE